MWLTVWQRRTSPSLRTYISMLAMASGECSLLQALGVPICRSGPSGASSGGAPKNLNLGFRKRDAAMHWPGLDCLPLETRGRTHLLTPWTVFFTRPLEVGCGLLAAGYGLLCAPSPLLFAF